MKVIRLGQLKASGRILAYPVGKSGELHTQRLILCVRSIMELTPYHTS